MKDHYHYLIQAYVERVGDNLSDFTEITVLALSEDEAIKKAKKMITKKGYRIAKTWECLEEHGLHDEMMMAQLELQKKMYDLAKGAHK